VGDIVGEPIDIHGLAKGRERQNRIYELLNVVGMNPQFVLPLSVDRGFQLGAPLLQIRGQRARRALSGKKNQ